MREKIEKIIADLKENLNNLEDLKNRRFKSKIFR